MHIAGSHFVNSHTCSAQIRKQSISFILHFLKQTLFFLLLFFLGSSICPLNDRGLARRRLNPFKRPLLFLPPKDSLIHIAFLTQIKAQNSEARFLGHY